MAFPFESVQEHFCKQVRIKLEIKFEDKNVYVYGMTDKLLSVSFNSFFVTLISSRLTKLRALQNNTHRGGHWAIQPFSTESPLRSVAGDVLLCIQNVCNIDFRKRMASLSHRRWHYRVTDYNFTFYYSSAARCLCCVFHRLGCMLCCAGKMSSSSMNMKLWVCERLA